jgi:hypothetical protein
MERAYWETEALFSKTPSGGRLPGIVLEAFPIHALDRDRKYSYILQVQVREGIVDDDTQKMDRRAVMRVP